MRRAAIVADGICLVAFVLGGRESHHVAGGAAWFLEVLWPVAVGWFTVAAFVGLYRRGAAGGAPVRWDRWAVTLAGGVATTLTLRALVQGRPVVVAFALVLTGFLAATTGGWRGAAVLVARRRDARLTARGAR